MTSLISRPTLNLSVSYDCDSLISLYNVWKVTNNECLACKQAPLLRLNNRLWRLLSEKLLRCSLRKIDHSYLDLNNAPLNVDGATALTAHPAGLAAHPAGLTTDLRNDTAPAWVLLYPRHPQLHESLLARPSLFLNPANAVIDASATLNNSVAARAFDSGDDTSDISEDDECDYSDDDVVLGGSSEESNCNHRLKQSRFVDHSSDSASPNQDELSQNVSTYGNSLQNSSRNASPNEASGITSCSSGMPLDTKVPPIDAKASPIDAKELKNIFFIAHTPSPPENTQENKPGVIKRQDSLFGTNLASTSGNHLSSVSSTDISDDDYTLDEDEHIEASQITKISKASRSTNEDDDSEWMSVSSDGEQALESPLTHRLSFAKVHAPRTPLTTIHDDASVSDVTRKPTPLQKPRSLLSGLFLNEMAHNSVGSPTSAKSFTTNSIAPPKPILKRSSTTGIITVDKNSRTREQAKGLRTSIILSKRYASYTDISRRLGLYRSPVLFVEEDEAPGESLKNYTNKSDTDSLLVKQTSSVELSKFMATATSSNPSVIVNTSGPIASTTKSPTHDAAEGMLSSSLSKYASLHPSAGSSFKSILSKSSLNISNLFGLAKFGKVRPPNHVTTSEAFKSPKQSEPLPSLFAGYLSQQNSQEAVDYEGAYTKPLLSKPIKVAPYPIKDFEPSIEISESLKDSLMIDHKLGKIVLPERVVQNDEFGNVAYVDDSNDYFSKGW